MYLFDLQYKLKQVNPNLQVLTDRGIGLTDVMSYPLVLKFGKRQQFNYLAHDYVDSTTSKYIAMKENGQGGEYICGISAWSPEYDLLDPKTGTVIARGYRSLAKLLAEKRVSSYERLSKIFRCPDLGKTDYDRATYEQKLDWARKEKR